MARMQKRPRAEVAEILRLYGDDYRLAHPASARQLAVMRHIASCRTAALGGHKDVCDSCGHIRISYNSCRDRHCPKCQNLKRAEWLENRKERLLPVPYFHVVFTLPDGLNPLILRNKRLLYDLLFKTAAETLKTIAKDKSISALKSDSPRSCIRGGKTCCFIPICIAWSPAVAFPRAGISG